MRRSTLLQYLAVVATATLAFCAGAKAQVVDYTMDEFQYKFTLRGVTAYLYIPAACTSPKAVFLLQENVAEQKVASHPYVRAACDAADVPIIWCASPFDAQGQTNPSAGVDAVVSELNTFGASIGYPGLGNRPIIAFGHSATNGWSQRYAEARPDKIMAVVATHGWDAIGKYHTPPVAGDTFINYSGPILSMIGDQWEMQQNTIQTFATLSQVYGIPSLSNVANQCDNHWMPITKIDQNGSGHHDYDDEMMSIIGMFIQKSVANCLDGSGNIKAIDRTTGWIAPGMSSAPTAPITIMAYTSGAAPTRDRCNWFFDQEFAQACANFVWGSGAWNRTYQMVWFNNSGGTMVPAGSLGFPNPVPFSIVPGTNKINIWAILADAVPSDFYAGVANTPLGHASSGTVNVYYSCGPYVFTDGNGDRRVKMTRGSTSGYFSAQHRGDTTYRRAVQPGYWSLGAGSGGATISNPGNQQSGAVVNLANNSTASEYAGYYVEYGPARVVNDYQLQILPLPANTTGPLEVKLVAFRLGASGGLGTASVTFNVSRPAGSTYSLTVNSGTGDGTYSQGTVVNITADAAPNGYAFSKWTGDTAYVANVNAATTSVTMPAQAVVVTATYVSVPTYSLTVNSGTGSGSYTQGASVPIVASSAPSGYAFSRWTGDTAYVANVNAASTSVTMPAQTVVVTATYVAVPTYSLTVNSGSGSGNYPEAASVPIVASTAPNGFAFSKWTGDTDHVANPNASSTSVNMPSHAVAVTATYVALPTYSLTVNSGTGSGNYIQGASVPIAADAAQPGYAFSKWTGDTAYVANVNSATTAVTMPAQAVVVTATYSVLMYSLTVNSGTGSGNYSLGASVPIVASAAPAEYMFSAWTGDTAYVANVSSATTSVTMPAQAVVVTATYVPLPKYTLTVNYGTGSGDYYQGGQIPVSADPAPIGDIFYAWTGDTQYVANVNSASTFVTMPAANVEITATYISIPVFTLTVNSGTGGGDYQAGTVVDIAADAAPNGFAFRKWSGDTAYLQNPNSAATKVTMPSANVAVTAEYAASFTLTVNSGYGSGSYPQGQVVNISSVYMAGFVFVGWIGDTDCLANASAMQTTVTMPAANVTVTPQYARVYTLIVNSGVGGGSYRAGAQVTITADPPIAGMIFALWQGDTQYVADATSASTTVTMPNSSVVLRATYVSDAMTIEFPAEEGVALERGSKTLITWTLATASSKDLLRVELINGTGQTWVLTEKAKASKGSMPWTVGAWKSKTQAPYPNGDTYRIRVSTLDRSITRQSTNAFAIGQVTSLSIAGPDTIDENSSAQYTCVAHFDYGADQDYTKAKLKWASDSKAAKVKAGLVTTGAVLADTPCTLSATYSSKNGVATGSMSITIKNR